MTSTPIGIVVGCGSVGSRHAMALSDRVDDLVLVEQNTDAAQDLARKFPNANIVSKIEDVDFSVRVNADSVAVISTWGPSHYEVFCKLGALGFKRILLEKPMAASIQTAADIIRIEKEENVRAVVHQRWRYLGLVDALAKISDRFDLGGAIAVHVSGGAICLATAGVHWIDFAHQLFGSTPVSVVSTARSEPLNPRSPELGFYGGTAVWEYPGGQEAVFSFSNKSSLAPQISVQYRDGTVEFPFSLEMTVKRRAQEAVSAQPKITRYGLPTEIHHLGQMLDPNVDTVRLCLDDLLGDTIPKSPTSAGFEAVQSLIGALGAGESGKRVELPLKQSDPSTHAEWPIS